MYVVHVSVTCLSVVCVCVTCMSVVHVCVSDGHVCVCVSDARVYVCVTCMLCTSASHVCRWCVCVTYMSVVHVCVTCLHACLFLMYVCVAISGACSFLLLSLHIHSLLLSRVPSLPKSYRTHAYVLTLSPSVIWLRQKALHLR